jgi:hypothetical protein
VRLAVFACVCALASATDAEALGVEIRDLRSAAADVTASIELRDVLPDRFRQTVERGGVIHLRIHTEVWEQRPVWDRLVYPAVVRMFRLARTPSGRDFAVYDPEGGFTTHAELPNPLPLAIRVGSPDRLASAARYYAKVIATIGTLAEREIDDAGDAVFGRPEESSGLEAFGRLVFKKVLEISDYLQSVSAQGTSRNIAGGQILRPPPY